jgi:trimeric autotransporter adhesin
MFLLVALLSSFPSPLLSQSAIHSSQSPVDESLRATLHGSVHPLARPGFDQGAVPDDFPVRRILVMLQRPPEREAARQRFLREVHTPGSPVFHQWVTPEEYGRQFGARDEDIHTVAAWLQAHGLSIARVTGSKAMIEFSGTDGQVREALHTEIHQYSAAGRSFYANDREISVPENVFSLIRNFTPLNNFPLTSYIAPAGKAKFSHDARGGAPAFTLTANNAPFYALAPEDFATQYDLSPVYSAGTNGSGQTIGIIGATNVNLALVNAYRELFNLPGDNTQIVVDGEDPGDGLAPNIEALLDIELSGAIAPNATVNFYVAGGQPYQNNLALAALRAVEDDQASVLSLSYGECEPLLGDAGNQLWAGLWEQAAAQGQTVLVASGDTGAAGLPRHHSPRSQWHRGNLRPDGQWPQLHTVECVGRRNRLLLFRLRDRRREHLLALEPDQRRQSRVFEGATAGAALERRSRIEYRLILHRVRWWSGCTVRSGSLCRGRRGQQQLRAGNPAFAYVFADLYRGLSQTDMAAGHGCSQRRGSRLAGRLSFRC